MHHYSSRSAIKLKVESRLDLPASPLDQAPPARPSLLAQFLPRLGPAGDAPIPPLPSASSPEIDLRSLLPPSARTGAAIAYPSTLNDDDDSDDFGLLQPPPLRPPPVAGPSIALQPPSLFKPLSLSTAQMGAVSLVQRPVALQIPSQPAPASLSSSPSVATPRRLQFSEDDPADPARNRRRSLIALEEERKVKEGKRAIETLASDDTELSLEHGASWKMPSPHKLAFQSESALSASHDRRVQGTTLSGMLPVEASSGFEPNLSKTPARQSLRESELEFDDLTRSPAFRADSRHRDPSQGARTTDPTMDLSELLRRSTAHSSFLSERGAFDARSDISDSESDVSSVAPDVTSTGTDDLYAPRSSGLPSGHYSSSSRPPDSTLQMQAANFLRKHALRVPPTSHQLWMESCGSYNFDYTFAAASLLQPSDLRSEALDAQRKTDRIAVLEELLRADRAYLVRMDDFHGGVLGPLFQAASGADCPPDMVQFLSMLQELATRSAQFSAVHRDVLSEVLSLPALHKAPRSASSLSGRRPNFLSSLFRCGTVMFRGP